MSTDTARLGEPEYEVYGNEPFQIRDRTRWARIVAGILAAFLLVAVVGGLAWRLSIPAPPAPGGTPEVTAVSWQGAALPVSSVDGPRVFTTTRASGFSLTPLGAALAATHISAHMDPYTGPDVFGPAISEQVTGNTSALLKLTRDTYAAAAKKMRVTGGQPILAPTGSITAWRIAAYSETAVTPVELYVRTPTGKDVVYAVPVQWTDGDWKVAPSADDDGVTFAVTNPDPNTDYTAFTSTRTGDNR